MLRRLLFLLPASGLVACALAAEPPKKYEVITPRALDVSATGINDRGEVVGFEMIEEKARPGVVEQVPFFARGKEVTHLPLLQGYTATFPAAVSDEGLVVGHVAKPAVRGRLIPLLNQAFTWDARAGIRGIGVLEGDSSSFASGITRDGRRISGYSVGQDRVRACVWDRDADSWKGRALPQRSARLGSRTIPISGDGRFVAVVDGDTPCMWSLEAPGRWTRTSIGEAGSLVPRAVNNSGTVVGLRFTPDGSTHAVSWSKAGGIRLIPEPAGYVRSEALAINNHGVIVGMIDGPAGSRIGPNAFAYEEGRLRILDEGGPNFASATAINDRGQVAGVLEEKEQ
jgi:uncharacterized membrane protein